MSKGWFALVCLLGACGQFNPPPSLEQPIPAQFAQNKITDASPELLKDTWWQTDDATLNAIIASLEVQNLSIAQAKERLNAARLPLQMGEYLPNLDANGNLQYTKTLKGISTNGLYGFSGFNQSRDITGYYNAKLDASLQLPLYGQYNALSKGDRAQISIAEADVAQVRATVIAEAVRLYALLRARQHIEQRQTEILAAHQKLVHYATLRNRAGLSTNTDLSTVKQAYERSKQETAVAASATIEAAQQLAGICGKTTPDVNWAMVADIPTLKLPPLKDTPLNVLSHRPDIRSARAAVDSAAAALDIAKSERYPVFSLNGSLSQLDNVTGMALLGKTVQVSGIPSVSIPLFDWGTRLNTAKQKDAQLAESAYKYRETVIGAMNEVETFFAAYRASEASLEYATNDYELANIAHRDAQALFNTGITDATARQNAWIAALQSDNNLSMAKADQVAKLSALAKALGGGVTTQANGSKEAQ